MASRIISPVPKVDVFEGLRSSTAIRGNPLADAISMIAVVPAKPYVAATGASSGPFTSIVISEPPRASTTASTVPSPPSATFISITSQSGYISCTPRAALSATSFDESEPLNESDATTIFFILSILFFVIYLANKHISEYCSHSENETHESFVRDKFQSLVYTHAHCATCGVEERAMG